MSLRHKTVAFAVLWVVMGTSAHAANRTPQVQSVSLEQYQAELSRIEAGVQAIQSPAQVAPIQKSVPDIYKVSTKDGEIQVENAGLKTSIGRLFHDKNREGTRVKLEQELRSMETGALAFAHPPDAKAAHAQLTSILAAREFDEVRGPTLIEVWRDKILNTLSNWWNKLMSKVPSPSGGHQEVTWILIAIAACVLAIWLKRIYERREPALPREIIPFAPSGKHWRSWLADAHAKAAEGHWRDAIHLAYWAAISHLESSGAWTPDSARTPREYLRLIKASNPSRSELAALTRDFERIWYGSQAAGNEEFAQSLQHLEQLGCR